MAPRGLLKSGLLDRAIKELSVTGLTLSPSGFKHAIQNSTVYDAEICEKLKEDLVGQELFFKLAIKDLRYATDRLRPIYDQTEGVDGWVSIDLSPLAIHDATSTLDATIELYDRVQRPNVLVSIPGTKENLLVVEEAIFTGVPVNVNLLFSCEQYLAAAEAFLAGIERRIIAGLKPTVGSFASMFIIDWDTAVAGKVPDMLSNRLGISMAMRTYKAYQDFLNSLRWKLASNAGVHPQRLLWAVKGTKDQKVSDLFYTQALAVPNTINAMSADSLGALVDCGDICTSMPADDGDCEEVLSRFTRLGIDLDDLADLLQKEGIAAYTRGWIALMTAIASKSAALARGFL